MIKKKKGERANKEGEDMARITRATGQLTEDEVNRWMISDPLFLFIQRWLIIYIALFFFQAEDGIRDPLVTGVQTCALPICRHDPCVGIRAVPIGEAMVAC